ncbi:MAG: DUF11 domain-containing protein [bacterium]|nr:DUF11 domain-containing protein [bacterium]
MKRLEQFLKKGVFAALCLLLLVSATYAGHNCDFAAVLALDGEYIADTHEADNLFYDFVSSRSSLHPWGYNPHGYGVLYAAQGQEVIPRETQLFYSASPYYYNVVTGVLQDPGEMDNAYSTIMTAANNAVMVMSHARWGTGGVGQHPFTFEYDGKTFAFMHNGSLYDENSDPCNIKEALWNELYSRGNGGGEWFETHNPNWINNGNYGNYTNFIDSELLFHWIMMNIDAHDGSVFVGLRTALTATIHESDGTAIDLEDYFMAADPDNKINFVLYDGSFYVYRNKPWDGNTYNLSYEVNDEGFVGIKTQGSLENRIPQYSLVRIQRNGDIYDYTNFHQRDFADLEVEMQDSPDPVTGGERLTYIIRIKNIGPYAANDVVVSDAIPASIPEAYYYFPGSRSAPWTGSVTIDRLAPGEAQFLFIYGKVTSATLPRSITNTVSVYESTSHIMNHDPDFSNNTDVERTAVLPPTDTPSDWSSTKK